MNNLLSVRYPIVQAPMLGVTSPDMVAAISNAGGLGSLPVGGLPPEKARALIQQTKAKTDKPFAVNIFAHPINSSNPDGFEEMEDFLESIYASHGLAMQRKPRSAYQFYNHTHLTDLLIEEQVSIISFTFGMLEAEMIRQFKQKGVILIGTATCVEEALLLEQSGVDAIVAQGIEAGGHRGTFLDDDAIPQVGLFSLLPQIVDLVSVPVIAAGGLFDHRSVKAAFDLGASAAQLGTYFITADESLASPGYKDAVLHAKDTSTRLTKAFTGRWARGIKNRFMEQVDQSGLAYLPYTYQNSMTSALRDYGKANNNSEVISLWAGQSASKCRRGSTHQLFTDLIQRIQQDNNPIF